MPSRVPAARHSAPATAAASQAFSGSGAVPATSALRGPTRERIARSSLRSATATSPQRPLARLRLGVEQDLLGGRAQHPHVGLHVALAVEQGGVEALARLQRLDVVGQLALQVLGGVGAGDGDDAALGAVEQAAFLAQLPVLGIELDGRLSHPDRF
jgi:hypothetical protein